MRELLWPVMDRRHCNVSQSCGVRGCRAVATAEDGSEAPAISSNVSKLIEELHYSLPRLDNSLSSAILDRVPRYSRWQPNVLHGRGYRGFQSSALRARRPRTHRRASARVRHLQSVSQARRRARRARYRAARRRSPITRSTSPFVGTAASLPWPASDAEIREVWRQNVKSDGLRLMLTGKTWPEAAEILKERYERSYKRITQLTSDDVFETFMNARRPQHGPALELSVSAPERGVPDPDEPVVRRHRRIAAARGRLRQGHEHHPGRPRADRRTAQARGSHHGGRRRSGRRARRRDRLAAR